jgi:hypothetical protein
MSGRVVSKPEPKHECSPGWDTRPCSAHPRPPEYDEEGMPPCPCPIDGPPLSIMYPPHSGDFPKGTVWRCDCGREWESQGRRGVGDFSAVFTPYRKPRAKRQRWWRRATT